MAFAYFAYEIPGSQKRMPTRVEMPELNATFGLRLDSSGRDVAGEMAVSV